jgi:large repetitive protein
VAAPRWRWRGALGLACAGLAVLLLPCVAVAAGGSLVTITSGPAEGETTASNTATFSFESGTPATFQCTLDGGAAESCDSGQITYTALTNGQHTFEVTATTTGDNVVSGSEARNWTVAVRPTATIFEAPPDPSDSSEATFGFASDQPDATFECSLDGAGPEACTSPMTYRDLAEQSHVFAVRAVDANIGSGTAAEYRWAVQAPPPGAIETSIVAGPPSPSASTDATFSFSADVARATFHCSLDGESPQPCTSPVTYSGLAAGTHAFKVVASTDSLVDQSPAEYSWDVALPVSLETTITSKPSNPSSSADATFEFTSNRSEATFECSLDSAGFTACTSPAAYERLSDGDHAFAVRAVRGGVQDTSPARYSWTIDASGSSTPWGWIIGGIVAALAVAAGIYYLIKRRRQGAEETPMETPPETPPAPPEDTPPAPDDAG